jgi:hypothetical protein
LLSLPHYKKGGTIFFKKKVEPSALALQKHARDITAGFRLQTDSDTKYLCWFIKPAQIGTFIVGF